MKNRFKGWWKESESVVGITYEFIFCLICPFGYNIRLESFGMQVPVDLVIDHSVQVDVARSENAVQANMELEFHRNKERFGFLKWGSSAFHNMLVVPPGSGIVHQVIGFC